MKKLVSEDEKLKCFDEFSLGEECYEQLYEQLSEHRETYLKVWRKIAIQTNHQLDRLICGPIVVALCSELYHERTTES